MTDTQMIVYLLKKMGYYTEIEGNRVYGYLDNEVVVYFIDEQGNVTNCTGYRIK